MDKSLKTGRFALIDQKAVSFGAATLDVVRAEIATRAAQRLFIVTTSSLADKAVEIGRGLSGLAALEIENKIPAHTPMPAVFALAQKLKAFAPDLVLAIGGGSVIDAIKIAGLVLQEGITTRDELIARSMQKGGVAKAGVAAPLRYIGVPTTLSGAEFGTIGGSVDPETKIKLGFASPFFPAEIVVFDPQIVTSTPDWLWLSSGIRAVDHAVEALVSPDANPFIDGQALHALTLLSQSLRATKRDPADLVARQQSQFGVWLAAQSVGRVRYGASHGIGHQLGAVGSVPHGYTSCVMLPSVMRWNLEATREAQARIHAAVDASAPDAASAIGRLIADLGLPTNLRDVGVGPDLFGTIAELALANPFVKANPRPVESPADILEILKLAS